MYNARHVGVQGRRDLWRSEVRDRDNTAKWICTLIGWFPQRSQFREQAANNSAHSPSKVYAGKETKGNGMNTWLAPLLFTTSLLAQPPEVRLPDESTGIDGIARTLVSVFDQADIIALGETHRWRLDTDLRIAVVRHPDFAKKVRSILGR
jgi:hypothetical protein